MDERIDRFAVRRETVRYAHGETASLRDRGLFADALGRRKDDLDI